MQRNKHFLRRLLNLTLLLTYSKHGVHERRILLIDAGKTTRGYSIITHFVILFLARVLLFAQM